MFAEFERATIVDRGIAGMKRKAARGGWTAGTFPYGYRIDPEAGHLVPRPDEAPLVPRIFELYASQRLGAKAVATELNVRRTDREARRHGRQPP